MMDWLRRVLRPAKATHRSGPARAWVSVWIGDLTDELDLDGYLYAFAKDHQLFRSEDCSAYTVKEHALPLDELLSEFSQAATWVPKLLPLAKAKGIETASCAVVLLHYLHEPVAEPSGPLSFVGAVAL